mmetsp:Transcript_15266/g.33306  ORF Transcript_15266/g.33306 Transcript_15266/m.33306 type:complete len:343 (+) Transcript_15266:227-1255(+)
MRSFLLTIVLVAATAASLTLAAPMASTFTGKDNALDSTAAATTPDLKITMEESMSMASIAINATIATKYSGEIISDLPPACPPSYDPSKTYFFGDVIELRGRSFQCNAMGFGMWCESPEWDDAYLEEDENAENPWNGGWAHMGPCASATLEEVKELVEAEKQMADSNSWTADERESSNDGHAATTATTAPDGNPDCTKEICSYELTESSILNYQVNVPEGKLSMKLIHDGKSWLGLAFSETGRMVDSDAVIGIPEENAVKKFYLGGKYMGAIQIMPTSRQTLSDASIQIVNGQTIMEFTKKLQEDGEIEILPGKNIMLFAYGSGVGFGYHGPGERMAFELDI